MKEKIKELRIKLDGLAQLVKELKPFDTFRIDVTKIPDGWDLQEFIEVFEKHGYSIEDGTKGIEPIQHYFKELEKSYDSLILAKAWLGKVLGELGQETPYKNDGKRKEVRDIEETADTKELNLENLEYSFKNTDWTIMNHIEKVDWLREEIKNVITISKNIYSEINSHRTLQHKVYDVYFVSILLNITTYLSEARFWLGFELQRIKEKEL
jgi:hypothetical protein